MHTDSAFPVFIENTKFTPKIRKSYRLAKLSENQVLSLPGDVPKHAELGESLSVPVELIPHIF